jgi:outer membrane protein assembly factor BamB
VYTLGAEGDLICLNIADGKVLWSRDLKADYGTRAALWGYAAHPLIDGNKLLCLAGGEGSHIVAFDKLTGKEIWKSSTSPEQGYSPPTIIEFGGARQLILYRPNAVSSRQASVIAVSFCSWTPQSPAQKKSGVISKT